MNLCLIFVLFGFLSKSASYPNGNMLLDACWDLKPFHENSNSSLNQQVSPFKITIENTFGSNIYLINDRLAGINLLILDQIFVQRIGFGYFLKVTISSDDPMLTFNGFMLQVKNEKKIGYNSITNENVTKFELAKGYWENIDSTSQTLNCFDIPNVS